MARVRDFARVSEDMFSGVVFDLDGVIVDSHPLHKRAWRAFLADLGKDVSESDLDFILEGCRRREILIHFLGELSESEIEEYGRRKDEFVRQASADLKAVTGSVEFIQSLKLARVRMAVATSASRQRAQWTLWQLGVAECFEAIVTGDDVANSKPDPAIYRSAAQRLSLAPELILAVEDSVSGVRSAKSAGMRCIGIGTGLSADALIQTGADHVLPNFAGLSIQDLKKMYQPPARPHFQFQAH
jgi:beta-phosphoglucomutase